MANITSLLNTIKSAVYGKDMRSAIHDSIKAVNDDVGTKESKISSGNAFQYIRGDKSLQDFALSVRTSIISGLSTSTNTAITAADTIISALGKLQAQINARLKIAGGNMSGNILMGNYKVISTATPSSDSDYTNKFYVDGVKSDLNKSILAIDDKYNEINQNMEDVIDEHVNALQAQINARLKIAGGNMSGNILMGNHKVISTATPSSDSDYTNKFYVDNSITDLRNILKTNIETKAIRSDKIYIKGNPSANGDLVYIIKSTSYEDSGTVSCESNRVDFIKTEGGQSVMKIASDSSGDSVDICNGTYGHTLKIKPNAVTIDGTLRIDGEIQMGKGISVYGDGISRKTSNGRNGQSSIRLYEDGDLRLDAHDDVFINSGYDVRFSVTNTFKVLDENDDPRIQCSSSESKIRYSENSNIILNRTGIICNGSIWLNDVGTNTNLINDGYETEIINAINENPLEVQLAEIYGQLNKLSSRIDGYY